MWEQITMWCLIIISVFLNFFHVQLGQPNVLKDFQGNRCRQLDTKRLSRHPANSIQYQSPNNAQSAPSDVYQHRLTGSVYIWHIILYVSKLKVGDCIFCGGTRYVEPSTALKLCWSTALFKHRIKTFLFATSHDWKRQPMNYVMHSWSTWMGDNKSNCC